MRGEISKQMVILWTKKLCSGVAGMSPNGPHPSAGKDSDQAWRGAGGRGDKEEKRGQQKKNATATDGHTEGGAWDEGAYG